MPLYSKAPAECQAICKRMLEKYHGELVDAGVTVDFLFAQTDPEKEEASALKLHGYACNAIVKVVSYKLRVQGHADAEIVIDGDKWPSWSDLERDALIDHEITHLELRHDKDGKVARDDNDRPKLGLRLHDHEFGWFDSIARRHGKASFEVQQYEQFKKQTFFEFADSDRGRLTPTDFTVSISTGGKTVTTTPEQLGAVARNVAKGSGRRAASKSKK